MKTSFHPKPRTRGGESSFFVRGVALIDRCFTLPLSLPKSLACNPPGGVRQELKFRTPMEEKHKRRIGNNHNNCHHIDEVHNGYIAQNKISNCAAN